MLSSHHLSHGGQFQVLQAEARARRAPVTHRRTRDARNLFLLAPARSQAIRKRSSTQASVPRGPSARLGSCPRGAGQDCGESASVRARPCRVRPLLVAGARGWVSPGASPRRCLPPARAGSAAARAAVRAEAASPGAN